MSAAVAAGSPPPMTNPKNRGPALAVIPGSAARTSSSTTSDGGVGESGSGAVNADRSASRSAAAATRLSGRPARNSAAVVAALCSSSVSDSVTPPKLPLRSAGAHHASCAVAPLDQSELDLFRHAHFELFDLQAVAGHQQPDATPTLDRRVLGVAAVVVHQADDPVERIRPEPAVQGLVRRANVSTVGQCLP